MLFEIVLSQFFWIQLLKVAMLYVLRSLGVSQNRRTGSLIRCYAPLYVGNDSELLGKLLLLGTGRRECPKRCHSAEQVLLARMHEAAHQFLTVALRQNRVRHG